MKFYKIKNGLIKFYPEILSKAYGEEIKFKNYKSAIKLNKYYTYAEISKRLGVNRITLYDWVKRGKKPHSLRSINLLKKKGLLPISTKNKRFLTLLDVFAWVFGDGHLARDGYFMLSGQRSDLEDIKIKIERDLKLPCKIIQDPGDFKNPSPDTCRLIPGSGVRPIGRLLIALGAPFGNKIYRDFFVPNWIFLAPDFIKKRFLEVLFSNEISIGNKKGNSFSNFNFVMYKSKNNFKSLIKFMSQISKLLKKFKIKSKVYLYCRQERVGVCLTIHKEIINLFRFYDRFKLIYAIKKQQRLEKIGKLLYERMMHHKNNIKTYHRVLLVRKKGLGRRRIAKLLNTNTYKVDAWLRRNCKPIYFGREKELMSLLKC